MRVSRRGFLRGAAAACLGGVRGWAKVEGYPQAAVARTPLGVLRGVSAGGVRVFRGVRFAEAPVGRLRFRPAVAAKGWSGVRVAEEFGPAPMQGGERNVAQSEDCLFLNIWAPEGRGPFPVQVWVHGGGYTGGYAFDPWLDGSELARNGIVSVTVGYRLGVFGFLDMAPLLGESYAGSANNALTDVMEGLRWVRGNIEAFGGDPGRVTVAGESAGAKLAGILLGVPAAEGLFAQVISESGGAERIWPVEQARAVAEGFGVCWREGTGQSAAALKTAPARELVGVQEVFIKTWAQHFPLRPELDRHLVPRPPLEAIASGASREKRVLLGSNLDESALFLGAHPGPVRAADLGNMGLGEFERVYAGYRRLYPEMTEEQRRVRAVTAEEYWVPTLRVAEALVRGGGQAWIYRLDFAETSGPLRGYSYHSLDLGMVWGHTHELAGNAGEEAALGRRMRESWGAFVKGGEPGWAAYSLGERATMILDTAGRVEERPGEGELRLWEGFKSVDPACSGERD